MFDLTDAELAGRILGCGDGPASFNAVLTRRGGRVVSVDPLYRFSQGDVRRRIRQTCDEILEQTRKNAHEFIWTRIKSVEELGQLRMAAMEEFLSDYPTCVAEKRYVDGELPHLPFPDKTFDLALCSHLIFLYSEHLSEDFHVESIKELCRVASEARVFPLLELGAIKSRHVEAVHARLTADGYTVSVETVPYEFQRGGNQMMTVKSGSEETGVRPEWHEDKRHGCLKRCLFRAKRHVLTRFHALTSWHSGRSPTIHVLCPDLALGSPACICIVGQSAILAPKRPFDRMKDASVTLCNGGKPRLGCQKPRFSRYTDTPAFTPIGLISTSPHPRSPPRALTYSPQHLPGCLPGSIMAGAGQAGKEKSPMEAGEGGRGQALDLGIEAGQGQAFVPQLLQQDLQSLGSTSGVRIIANSRRDPRSLRCDAACL